MNIYNITSYYYNRSDKKTIYNTEYLVHKKEFSEEEFDDLCNIGLKCSASAWGLSDFLIENYGFEKLPITQRFWFNEPVNKEE